MAASRVKGDPSGRNRRGPDVKKTIWDLSELYSGRDDPAVESDLARFGKQCRRLAERYRGQVSKLDARALRELMADLEAINKRAYRLMAYAHLEFSTKSNNPEWGAFVQSVQERVSKSRADLEFFASEWTRVSEPRAVKLIRAPELSRYRHFLESTRKLRQHTLTELEEALCTRLDVVASSGWRRYYNTVLSDIDFRYRGKRATLAGLAGLFYDPDREVRREASESRTEGLLRHEKPLTFAFNMVLAAKMIDDDVRSFEHWAQRRNLDNEIPDDVVGAMVKAVLERTDIIQRYMRLKAKLLGVDPLMSYDVYAPLPGVRPARAHYGKSVEMVAELFAETRPAFGRIAREMFRRNHVDAPTYRGKRSGAFCTPNYVGLPYVLLNWTGKMRDAGTLAHEFGHAVHMELSRKRGPMGATRSLVMGEVASVFMQTLLHERLLKGTRNARARLDLLRQIIEEAFATTFRQIQLHLFETAAHEHRRAKGELSREKLGKLLRVAEKRLFGDTVKPHKGTENFWMYVTHFVNYPAYVYAYCASFLIVLAIYRRYQEVGPKFLVAYEKTLAAGGSRSPSELLGELGVDWSRPAVWQQGLEVLAAYVDRFESTADQLGLL